MGSNGSKRGARRRHCDSYKVFKKNVERSRAFIRIFGEDNRRKGTPDRDERELLRGALVFAIGALDNFMHELILEMAPRFGDRSAMKEPLKAIARDDPSLALRVALAGSGEVAEAEFRVALDAWLESRSFHGVSKIVDAARLVGVKLDESKLDPDWKARLEEYTDRRHQIVHRGDTKTVTKDTALACTALVESIGTTINSSAVRHYH